MNSAELEAIASRVFGYGWQTKLAAYLEVADRTVRRWVAGQPIPSGVEEQILALIRIAPPTPNLTDDERDAACRAALYPRLHDLSNLAIDAGWEPAEVLAATLAWVTQQTVDLAGHDAARALLREAADAIDADERS